ncbi:MAG: class I SAM-dependent methyltransferase [Stellaceae bacterium]
MAAPYANTLNPDGTPAPYGRAFYRALGETSEKSARRIVPMVLELASLTSVVDIGCGVGSWLAAFRDAGVNDVLGLDGPWVDDAALKIPLANFRRARLDEPLDLKRRFDLAVCVEVAEHLPAARAAGLVAELAELAPLVLFSAAVPGQGGTEHVNEQWPGYWAALFAARGYRAIDTFRKPLWDDPDVAFWYKQNLLLYAGAETLAANPALDRAAAATPEEPIALVHPDLYRMMMRRARPRIGRWLKMAPEVVRRSLGRKTKG